MQDYNFYDFYFSLTCNVHYRGQRIQAQIIIPGIIFNSESMIEYGQIEEGNIKYSEVFYDEIRKFNAKIGVDENVIVDKDGKEFKFSGHPEIKGVRGIDKRKYLFDLIHILPRDVNYLGADNLGCILRPELIAVYKYKTTDEKLQLKYASEFVSFNKELEELNKNHTVVKNYKQSLEELLIKRKDLYDKIRAESTDIVKFNTCLFTNVKFSENETEKLKLAEDEKLLYDLAKFVKEDMINEYIKKFGLIKEDLPYDSKSLSDSIHRYGINCRYYGEIINRIEKTPKSEKNNSWLKTLIVRDIYVRSARHIFDNLLKNIPSHLSTYFIAHFLNIFLCSAPLIKMLEQHEVLYIQIRLIKVTNLLRKTQITLKKKLKEREMKKPTKRRKIKRKQRKTKNMNLRASLWSLLLILN
jgi:protein TIF31